MNASLWQLAGWTMIHSLWLGAAVALAGGIVRLAARRATPSTRYAISLATLTALAISPLAAAAWLSVNGVPQLATTNFESILPPLPSGAAPAVSGSQFPIPTASDYAARQSAYPLLHSSLTLPIEDREPDDARANGPAPLVIDLAHSDPSPRYSGERLGEGQNQVTAMPFAVADAFPNATVGDPSPSFSPATGAPLPADHQSPITDYLSAAISYLPILWLVGAPLTFTLLAAGLVGSERLRRRATPLVAGPAFDACQRMRTALRITRRVALAACDGVAQPVLVGVFRPLILLPTAALAGWTPEQLDMILLHELAHVRRWDNLVNLLQRIVESILFYHPAVWILSRQVRHDREECCDATVIRHTDRPHQYAELLVSIAAALRGGPAPSLAVASAMASHPLAGRIRRILNIEAEPMRITRRTLAATLLLPALLAGAILYSGANAEDASSPPLSKEQPSTLAVDKQAQGGSTDAGGVSNANQPSTVASEENTPADSNVSTDANTPNASQPNAPTSQEPASANSADNDLAAEIARLEPLVQQHKKDFVERDVLKTILSNDSLSSQLIEQSIRDSVHRAPDVESATKRLRETKDHLAHLAHVDAPLDETKIRRLQQLRGQLTEEVADAEENYVKQQQAIFDSIPRERLHQGLRERLARIEKSLEQSEEHATDLALAKRMAEARKTTSKPTGDLSSSNQDPAAPANNLQPTPTDEDSAIVTYEFARFPQNVDMRRWMEIIASDRRFEAQWRSPGNALVLAGPKSGHAQLQALLDAARQANAADPNQPPQPPAFKPILTHNLSDKDSAPLIGGYGILQEFPANAPQSAVDAVVNRLKADNRRFSVEQSDDGRRRIVDQTPPREMEVLREIRRLESLVEETENELKNLEVVRELAVQSAPSLELANKAAAEKLNSNRELNALSNRISNLDRDINSGNHDATKIDELKADRKKLEDELKEQREQTDKKIRDAIANTRDEARRSMMVEYKIHREAADKKLAKYQQELGSARQKLSQLSPEIHIPTLQSEIRNLEALAAEAREEVVNLEVYKQIGGYGPHPGSSELEQAIAKEVDKDPTVNELRQKLFEQQTQLQTQLAESKSPNSTAIKKLRTAVQLTEAELAKHAQQLEKSLREKLAHIPADAKAKVEADYNARYQTAKGNLAKLQQDLESARQKLSQLSEGQPATPSSAAPTQEPAPPALFPTNSTLSNGWNTPPQNGSTSAGNTKSFHIPFPTGFPNSERERERVRQSIVGADVNALLTTLSLAQTNGDGKTSFSTMPGLLVTIPADWQAKPVWETNANGEKTLRIINEAESPQARPADESQAWNNDVPPPNWSATQPPGASPPPEALFANAAGSTSPNQGIAAPTQKSLSPADLKARLAELFPEAVARSRKSGKPMLIHALARNSAPSRRFESETLADPNVADFTSQHFEIVTIYADEQPAFAEALKIDRVPANLVAGAQRSLRLVPADVPSRYLMQLQTCHRDATTPPASPAAAHNPAMQPLLTPEDRLKKELADTRQQLVDRLAELKEQSADDLQKIRAGEVPASREEDESFIALREKIQAMSEARLKAEEGPDSPAPDAAPAKSPADDAQPTANASPASLQNDIRDLEAVVGKAQQESDLEKAIALEILEDPAVTELQMKLWTEQSRLQLYSRLAEAKSPNFRKTTKLRSDVQRMEAELAKHLQELEKSAREKLSRPPKDSADKSTADYRARRNAANEKLAEYQRELAAAKAKLAEHASSEAGSAAPFQEPEPPAASGKFAPQDPAMHPLLTPEEGPAPGSPLADAVSKSYPADKVRPINAEKFSQALGSSALVIWDLQNRTLTVNAPEQVHARIAELLKIEGKPAPPRSDNWPGGKIRTALAADRSPEALERAFQRYERNGADVVGIPHDDGSMSIVDATPEYTASRRQFLGGMTGPASAPTGAAAPAADVPIQRPQPTAAVREFEAKIVKEKTALVELNFFHELSRINDFSPESVGKAIEAAANTHPAIETFQSQLKKLDAEIEGLSASGKPASAELNTLVGKREELTRALKSYRDNVAKDIRLAFEQLPAENIPAAITDKNLQRSQALIRLAAYQRDLALAIERDDESTPVPAFPSSEAQPSYGFVAPVQELPQLSNPRTPILMTKPSINITREQFRRFFEESNGNPQLTKSYTVPHKAQKEIAAAISEETERILGSNHPPFNLAWRQGEDAAHVTAPALAHRAYFRTFFANHALSKLSSPPQPQLPEYQEALKEYDEASADAIKAFYELFPEPQASAPSRSPSPFPTLEHQKLADRAYRILGLELEPLTPEELERVKKLGYEGGLRIVSTTGERRQEFMPDDILVGLHAWPVTDFQSLDIVFNRDDLAELNPLKYYVARNKDHGGPFGSAAPIEDRIVTGRLQMNPNILSEHYRERSNRKLSATPKPESGDLTHVAGEPTFLYDGKTFEQWRDLWKLELNPKRRVEAIKALTSFSRAGRGREAADAVFEVASQYDFAKSYSNEEDEVKFTVITLCTKGGNQIATTDWIPALEKVLKKDPKQNKALAIWLLQQMQDTSDEAKAALQILATNDDPEIRAAAEDARMWREKLLEKLMTADKDGDQQLSKQEVGEAKVLTPGHFQLIDKNEDGQLSIEELQKAMPYPLDRQGRHSAMGGGGMGGGGGFF